MAEQLELLILTCIKHHSLDANNVMNMVQVDITLEAEFIQVLMKMAADGYVIYEGDKLSITAKGRTYQLDRFSKWQNTSNILIQIMQDMDNE